MRSKTAMDRLSNFKLGTGDELKRIGTAWRRTASSCNAFAIATFSSWSNLRYRQRGTPLWHIRSGWTPKCRITKFGLKKLETLLYRTVLKYPQTIFSFCHNPRVWQTDRKTHVDSKTMRMHSQSHGKNVCKMSLWCCYTMSTPCTMWNSTYASCIKSSAVAEMATQWCTTQLESFGYHFDRRHWVQLQLV